VNTSCKEVSGVLLFSVRLARAQNYLSGASVLVCLMLVHPALLPAQGSAKSNSATEFELRNFRIDSVTRDIVSDSSLLSDYDRAVLWARLGSLWWKEDQAKATKWLQKAFEVTRRPDQKENERERKQRQALIRILIPIVTPLEADLAAQLAENLTDSDQDNKLDNETAEVLVRAALAVIGTNPKLAARLGSAAIHAGDTYLIFRLLRSFQPRDDNLSNALFDEVLTAAQSRLSEVLINNSITYAFPRLSDRRAPDPLPIAFKVRLLNIVRARMSLDQDEETTCHIAIAAAPLMEEYARLSPEGEPYLSHRISMCRSQLDPLRKEILDRSQTNPLSVEDAMRAFEESKTPSSRMWYLSQAFEGAAERDDYDVAVGILDGLSEADRKQLGDKVWEGLRWNYAASAAYAKYQKQDLGGMNKVIADTPAELRALVEGFLARKLIKKPEVAVGLLENARRDFPKLEKTNPNRQGLGINLVRLYAVLKPVELLVVFKEAMMTVDQIKGDAEKDEEFALKDPIVTISIPVELAQHHDSEAEEVVAAMKSTRGRVQARLGLLEAWLQQKPMAKTSLN
jgi:hypothetical protein